MFVVLKSFSGMDFLLDNGKKISLNGGCVVNDITKADFNAVIAQYPQVQEQIDNGFIVVSGNVDIAKKQSSKAVDDTKQDLSDKQDADQTKNKKSNNVDLNKD